MTVFVDTSGFIAALDADDLHHGEATDIWNMLATERAAVFTTNYVVVETVSIVHHRFGIPAVRRFLEHVIPVCTVEWVDQTAHETGIAAVMSGGRRGPSLVDSVSFEYMRRNDIEEALAFDRHFDERGYRLPGASRSP